MKFRRQNVAKTSVFGTTEKIYKVVTFPEVSCFTYGKEMCDKGKVRIMKKNEKKTNHDKRMKVLFVSCVTLVTVIVLCGLGWYVHHRYYLKTTTLIPELQAIAPKQSQDMVFEDEYGRQYYELTREGSVVNDEAGIYLSGATFACFDEEKGKMWTSYAKSKKHSDEVLSLYNSFAKVRGKEVTDWTMDKLTYPIYSIEFFMREGTFWGVWSNGYLITNAHKTYKLDYDFSEFEKAGNTMFTYSDVGKVNEDRMLWPILQYTVLTENGTKWKADALKPSIFDVGEMEGLTMTVKEVDLESFQRTITIEIRNDSTSDIKYGTKLHMETLVDGKWYQPLVDPTGALVTGVDSLMNTLQPGETKTVKYNVMAYLNPPLAQNRAILYVYKDGERAHVAAEF